jgi:hypothetical protein
VLCPTNKFVPRVFPVHAAFRNQAAEERISCPRARKIVLNETGRQRLMGCTHSLSARVIRKIGDGCDGAAGAALNARHGTEKHPDARPAIIVHSVSRAENHRVSKAESRLAPRCPSCRTTIGQQRRRYHRTLRDLPVQNVPVIIGLRVRTWRRRADLRSLGLRRAAAGSHLALRASDRCSRRNPGGDEPRHRRRTLDDCSPTSASR